MTGTARRGSLTVTAVLCTALLAACGGSSGDKSTSASSSGTPAAGTPVTSKTLTTAISANIASLDPPAAASADAAGVVQMVTEPLAYFDAQQKLRPLLATSWKPEDGGKRWVFTLRKGVKFSNGEPFNADAVKFTFDRLLSKKTINAYAGSLSVIKQVNVVDDATVEFVLNRVYPALPSAVTPANASIVAPGAAEKAPNTVEKLTTPIGTGPYVYKRFAANDQIVVDRNEGYWGTKPAYKTQVIRMVPAAATREAMLRAKQADVIAIPPAPDLPALRANPQIKLIQAPSGYMIQVGFNTVDEDVPALKKPEVRQALQYAIDRESLVKNVLFEGAKAPDSPITANVFGYCQAGNYGYDPEKAKQMLAAAGASNLRLKMQSPQGRYVADYQVAQAVAGDLRKVGVQVDLAKPPDFATYIAGLYVPPDKAKADLSLIGWGTIFPDASEALGNLLSTSIPPKGVSNFYYYDNPTFEAAMKVANTSLDANERKAKYCEAQKEVWNNPPALFLYVQQTNWATSSSVTGVYANNLWFVTTWAAPKS